MRYGSAEALSLRNSLWTSLTAEPAHALVEIEKVWPADRWPPWVPALACAICVFALSGTPLYIAAQVNQASNFDLDFARSKQLWNARFLTDLGELLQYTRASVLIATSITVATRVGDGIGTSGLVVGAFWASYWIGAVSFRFGGGTVASKKLEIVLATALMMVSTIGAAFVALRLPPHTIPILCGIQALSGATGAYAAVFREMVRKYVYPPDELMRAVTRRKLCQAIGTSCGPLLSAAAGVVIAHPDQGYVAGILVLGPVFVVYIWALHVFYPADLSKLVLNEHSESVVTDERADPVSGDVALNWYLVTSMVASILLTICVSFVENVTVAILSTEFNYTFIQGGIFVSFSFFAYPLVDYVYDQVRKDHPEERVFRFGMVSAAIAAVLMSGSLCSWSGSRRSCLYFILASDMVMFPLLQLCQGILNGWALRYARNDGMLSATNISIIRVVLSGSVARGCAPWLGRRIIEQMGRDSYAIVQILIISCALLLVEVSVIPFVQRRKSNAAKLFHNQKETNSPSMDSTAPSTPMMRGIV